MIFKVSKPDYKFAIISFFPVVLNWVQHECNYGASLLQFLWNSKRVSKELWSRFWPHIELFCSCSIFATRFITDGQWSGWLCVIKLWLFEFAWVLFDFPTIYSRYSWSYWIYITILAKTLIKSSAAKSTSKLYCKWKKECPVYGKWNPSKLSNALILADEKEEILNALKDCYHVERFEQTNLFAMHHNRYNFSVPSWEC